MTVASEINKKRIEGNGVTVIFPANIKIFNEGDVKVTTILRADDTLVDTLILNDGGALGYTIVFDSDAETLTVTTNTAPINTEDLQILRDLDITQTSDFPRVNKFPAELNENSLDKSIMVIQDQQEQLDRALTLPEETTVTNLELPAPNAGKALLWNATADSIENSTDDFNDIVTDATAQAVIATTQAGIATTQAGISTANAALTAADVDSTNADVVTTNADVVLTNADVVLTGLDVVATAADRVQTGLDATSASNSAAAAQVAKIEWQGTYNAGTTYALNDAVTYLGSSFINIQAGTGQTPIIGGTVYWDDLANKGDTGSLGDISGQPSATITASDELVFADVDDSNLTKKDTVQGIIDLIPAGGGAWDLLATRTADTSSSLDFTSLITSTYDEYRFIIIDLYSGATAASVKMQSSDDNGITYDRYINAQMATRTMASTAAPTYSNPSSGVNGIDLNIADTKYVCGWVTYINPLATIGAGLIKSCFLNPSNAKHDEVSANTNTNAITAVRFLPSINTFVTGKILMYGLKNT